MKTRKQIIGNGSTNSVLTGYVRISVMIIFENWTTHLIRKCISEMILKCNIIIGSWHLIRKNILEINKNKIKTIYLKCNYTSDKKSNIRNVNNKTIFTNKTDKNIHIDTQWQSIDVFWT